MYPLDILVSEENRKRCISDFFFNECYVLLIYLRNCGTKKLQPVRGEQWRF